ncbi:MAG: transcriptional repressor LexA [Deferribacteres bacterium]|nr:transcriptional repressor LexA [candidate division KSB1 bacterium]MCB9502484.1 transcriptional repressor LexA [Deferribacteres bacterium]
MKKLTEKQKTILGKIADNVRTIGYPPTMQELADDLGVRSKNAIFKHLEALEKKGYIKRSAGGARGITILDNIGTMDKAAGAAQIAVIGQVAAGSPILAEQNVERYISVPDYLTNNPGTYYALRVQGDSMIDAGIMEDDLVIVRSTNHADHGDIVVALNDDDATVKRFVSRGADKFLKPENSRYQSIPITQGWSIQGKVVALIREHL